VKMRCIHIIIFLILIHIQLNAQDTTSDSVLTTFDTSSVYSEEDTTTTYDEEEDEETNAKSDSSELRSIPASQWDSILKDKSFVYSREKKKVEKEKPASTPPMNGIGNFLNAGFFKFLMFLMVGFILFFVIRHFFFSGEFNFSSYRKKKTSEDEHDFENIEQFSDWDIALKKALDQNDYRLATRVLYLETLQKLNQRGWIKFEQEKTNWDYVNQMSSNHHNNTFTLLTKYFDYIWYGSFTVNQEQYQQLEQSYRNFQRSIE